MRAIHGRAPRNRSANGNCNHWDTKSSQKSIQKFKSNYHKNKDKCFPCARAPPSKGCRGPGSWIYFRNPSSKVRRFRKLTNFGELHANKTRCAFVLARFVIIRWHLHCCYVHCEKNGSKGEAPGRQKGAQSLFGLHPSIFSHLGYYYITIMMRAEEHMPLLGGRKRERRRRSSRERGATANNNTTTTTTNHWDSAADDSANKVDAAAQHIRFSNSEDDIFIETSTTPSHNPLMQSRRRPVQQQQQQPQGPYSGGIGSFDKLAPDNVGTPPRNKQHNNPHHQQKQDRRNLLQRARQFVRQKMVLPLWGGYQNIDGNAAEHHHQARCTMGTREMDGTWLNYTDQAGTAMALLVWVLIGYCAATMIVLARHGHMAVHVCAAQVTLSALIWACHAKTMLTDPGTIPSTAVPLVTKGVKFHTMCSVCQSYKPSYTHHCRICNRCISRMDHHCPW